MSFAPTSPAARRHRLYGALEEILTGWVMGLLPDGEDEVAKAEQAVVSLLCDGLLAPS